MQSSVKNIFIRGSVVRYVHLPAASVDIALLEDATRRGMQVLTFSSPVCASRHAVLIRDVGSAEAAQQGAKAR